MLKEITTVLEQVRRERGMTKAELARRAEMQQSVIGWIETGRFKPYESQLEKLAAALDWDGEPHRLMEEVENEPNA